MTQPLAPGQQQGVAVRSGGLTKEQLLTYFRRRYSESDQRSEVVREMYDKDDLSLVTETHAQMVLPKVGLKVLLAAMDPKRTKTLMEVWLDAYNAEMISFKRQGRHELLGALQALAVEEEERTTRV